MAPSWCAKVTLDLNTFYGASVVKRNPNSSGCSVRKVVTKLNLEIEDLVFWACVVMQGRRVRKCSIRSLCHFAGELSKSLSGCVLARAEIDIPHHVRPTRSVSNIRVFFPSMHRFRRAFERAFVCALLTWQGSHMPMLLYCSISESRLDMG